MSDPNSPSSQPQADVTVTPASSLPVAPEALALGYEPERIGFRGYAIFVGSLVVSAIVVLALLWVIMRAFDRAESRGDQARSSGVQLPQPIVPPGPLLEPSPAQGPVPRRPWQDMAAYRVHEEELLSTYGYDPKTGQTRIPIDRAMRLLVQRGLPTTQPSMRLPMPATRQVNPESSGGR